MTAASGSIYLKSFLPVKSARAMHTVLNSMFKCYYTQADPDMNLYWQSAAVLHGQKIRFICQAADPHKRFEARM